MGLANDIASLIDMVSQNKKLDAENAKYLLTQFYSNKYIALSKANIKLSATQPSNEVDKLKMELELGKVKNKFMEFFFKWGSPLKTRGIALLFQPFFFAHQIH